MLCLFKLLIEWENIFKIYKQSPENQWYPQDVVHFEATFYFSRSDFTCTYLIGYVISKLVIGYVISKLVIGYVISKLVIGYVISKLVIGYVISKLVIGYVISK